MTSNQCYQIMLYVCTKNLQQGYLSPDDFYTSINTAQIEYTDYLLGEYQKRVAQRPIAPVQVGNTEKIRNSLSPLVYNTILTPNSTTGIAAYPDDFEMADAMWGVYNIYNIRFVNQPRLQSFQGSSIDPVEENPIYLLRWEGFQFYPEHIGLAKLSYFRKPPSIVWGYVPDSNGVPVWNPATSQDPVWSETDMMNIISRALRLVGVNLDANQVTQFANEIKFNGQ